jgi:DNA-binding SARP family transcriptional activator
MRRRAPSNISAVLVLIALPTVLVPLAGWPLSTTPPSKAQLTQWMDQPLTHASVTGAITLAAWGIWTLLAAAAVTEMYGWVRHRCRMPHLAPPRPLQVLAAALLGTTAAGATLGTPAHGGATAPSFDHNDTDRWSSPDRSHLDNTQEQPVVAAATAGRRARAAAAPTRVRSADHQATIPRGQLGSTSRRVHHVVQGDTLWDIAERKLGDPFRWREIYRLNRGQVQANGYALTDPDEIHVGWVLALPTGENAPDPTRPAPGNPVSGDPAAADPIPGNGQSTVPSNPLSTPPASSTSAPGSSAPGTTAPGSSPSSTPAPTGRASGPWAPATPADETSPDATSDSDAQPHADERDGGTGITLPAEGWVSFGLAATIAAVAAMLRLQRRRRARLSVSAPVSTAPQPAPVPPSLARVDAVGSHHLGTDPRGRPAGPAVAAPIGVDADGAEVSLFDLPGAGLALQGDGAIPAARAALASVLSTGATGAVDARPVVVITADLLVRLLPGGAPSVGLDRDGTAYDGERLIVLADTAAAVTHAEEEVIGRRRLLDTFDVDTIADLNARTDHAETQPPYVLLIDATTRHAARVQAVAAHRAALDLHPVIVGSPNDLDGLPAVEVAADGSTEEPGRLVRLSTLGAAELAAVLGMLTDALARPQLGTDVDDPPAEPAPMSAEPAERVPVQPGDGSALVRLRVLGPVTIATEAGPIATGIRSGSYTTLALLAAHPAGRTLDQLAAALHPNTDPTVAVKRVRTDINSVRRVLRAATGHDEAMFVVYDQSTGRYRLDPDTVTVDLWQMLTAIEQANTAARDADGDTAALAALRQAAELYGGDFADGQDRAWAVDYATTYRHQILTVYARIAEILEVDYPDEAVAALERAVELDPVNEELYQRIMRIHGRQQRPDAVRRTLRRLEARLADLDEEPSQASRRVAERQLRPAVAVSGGQR